MKVAGNQAVDEVVDITTTFALAQVDPASPPGSLLDVLAFLASDDIPKVLLLKGGAVIAPEDRGPLEDLPHLNQALAVLAGHSLISVTVDAVGIQRRVQELLRDRQSNSLRRAKAAMAGQLVLNSFPRRPDDRRTWFLTSRLIPHALAVADHLQGLGNESDLVARLLIQAARYLAGFGAWKDARQTLERAVAIVEAEKDSTATFATANTQLGVVALAQGEFDDARVRLERALAVHRTVPGDEEGQIGDDMAALGRALVRLGHPADARALLQQALEIHERTYGPAELEVAEDLVALAEVAVEEGKLGEALALLDRAARDLERRYGPDDQDVVSIRFHLQVFETLLRGATVDSASMEAYLDEFEQAYGPKHYEVAGARRFLADILEKNGDLEGAQEHLNEALAIHRTTYGDRHYEVATDLLQLASLLLHMGKPQAAETTLEELATILNNIGPANLEGFIRLSDLVRRLADMGEIEETRDSLFRAVAVFRQPLVMTTLPSPRRWSDSPRRTVGRAILVPHGGAWGRHS